VSGGTATHKAKLNRPPQAAGRDRNQIAPRPKGNSRMFLCRKMPIDQSYYMCYCTLQIKVHSFLTYLFQESAFSSITVSPAVGQPPVLNHLESTLVEMGQSDAPNYL
jgi:hypothetical protein